jgi:tetratricopeptide (TPR) repeat protein
MSSWEAKKIKGNEEFKKKNYAAAVGLYTEGITLDPSQDVLYSNRGLSYMNLNEPQKAKMDFSKALELNPKNIKAMKRISYMLIQEGLLLEALIYLKKIIKIDREEPAILNEIEECEKLIEYRHELDDNKIINDWNKCFDLSSKLIKKCNKCFEIKLSYLESMVNSYQIDDALNFFKNELDSNEQKLDNVQFLLIKAYFNDGKYEKSKQLLMNLLSNTKDGNLIEKTKQLSEKLEQIEVLKEKANKFYKNNNFSDAINVYNELLSLDNNNKIFNALILSNRSLCYYKLKDMFNALHDINASIKLNDKYWKSFQRRAHINIKLKYSEQAKDDLRKVLELDPSNREAKSLLDDILKEERKKGAKDLYMILGVSRNSSIEEIRRGFKKLAAKWHPDKNNQTEEKKIFAEKKFKEINSAYTILIDPYKREIYDKTGKDENIEQKYKPEENNNNNYKRERSRDKEQYMREGFHY